MLGFVFEDEYEYEDDDEDDFQDSKSSINYSSKQFPVFIATRLLIQP